METRDTTGPGRDWKKDGADYKLGRYAQLGQTVLKNIRGAHLYELEGVGHMP